MPRYSLVGCSSCDALKIVDGNPKTTACSNCDARLKFRKLKRFYEDEDITKVSQAKAILLSRRAGKEEEVTELIEAGLLDNSTVNIFSDEEYLAARGVDPAEAEAASDTSIKRTPSREEQVLTAVSKVESPTKANITVYVVEQYGTEGVWVEKMVESLYLKGELSRNPDGTYREV